MNISSVPRKTVNLPSPFEISFMDEGKAKIRLAQLAKKHSKLLCKLAQS